MMPFLPPRPFFYRVPPPPPPYYRVPPPYYTVSPPPPPPPPPFYDASQSKNVVFISFRGDDTRQSLTSHLYEALRNEGILTFVDKNLERGHEIWPDILQAIERSWISIVIFSEGYASSRWCLEELVKILECKKKYCQIVIPIFYKVDLSHVKNQTGTFADAFAKHEVNFKEKVHKWRDALREATDISGFDSKQIWPEAELVKHVVRDILRKVSRRKVEEIWRLQNMYKRQFLNNPIPIFM